MSFKQVMLSLCNRSLYRQYCILLSCLFFVSCKAVDNRPTEVVSDAGSRNIDSLPSTNASAVMQACPVVQRPSESSITPKVSREQQQIMNMMKEKAQNDQGIRYRFQQRVGLIPEVVSPGCYCAWSRSWCIRGGFGIYPFLPRSLWDVCPIVDGTQHVRGGMGMLEDKTWGQKLVSEVAAVPDCYCAWRSYWCRYYSFERTQQSGR